MMSLRRSAFSFCLLYAIINAASISSRAEEHHVVLVIIDGARYSETLGDPASRFVPRMTALAAAGAVADSFLNDGFTYTSRAVPAIWTGSWAPPRDTVIGTGSTQYTVTPTLWEYHRKATGHDSTYSLYLLRSLSNPWLPSFHPDYGPSYWPWYILQGNSDLGVWQNARGILAGYHPPLAVIYFSDVDHYGHSGDWQAYTRAITVADSIVGLLWDFLQTDPVYKNTTTLLVTNDHGRHLDGVSNGFVGHGDACWGCRHIMLLAAGSRVPQGTHLETRHSIPDIVPTIGDLLQFPTPYATGSVITELLLPATTVAAFTGKPGQFSLEQNYPNPFNPTTTIRYTVGGVVAPSGAFSSGVEGPDGGHVRLVVYDMLGREVTTLVNEIKPAGRYTVQFNAANLASGMYFYRLRAHPTESRRAESFVQMKKMLLVK